MEKVLMMLALVATTALWAADFSAGGIYYNILEDKTNEVEVISGDWYAEYSGSVTIPSTVTYNGTTYSVTSIGDYAFKECSNLKAICIPKGTKARFAAMEEIKDYEHLLVER